MKYPNFSEINRNIYGMLCTTCMGIKRRSQRTKLCFPFFRIGDLSYWLGQVLPELVITQRIGPETTQVFGLISTGQSSPCLNSTFSEFHGSARIFVDSGFRPLNNCASVGRNWAHFIHLQGITIPTTSIWSKIPRLGVQKWPLPCGMCCYCINSKISTTSKTHQVLVMKDFL